MLLSEYITKYEYYKKYFSQQSDSVQFLMYKDLINLDLAALYRTETISLVGKSTLDRTIRGIDYYIKNPTQ